MKFPDTTVQTACNSPLGRLLLAASATHLVGLWFDGQPHLPDMTHWRHAPEHPVLLATQQQLHDYFAGQRTTFDLPLDVSAGTPFQQAVWRALLNIAPGGTCSYGALSAAIGKPTAVRAVGGAVGRNPLGIIVPCHRVIGANGSLTGYTGGLQHKVALLQLEGVL
jgi:methylated-DNA-[protein]-cysteine S-methyltransferase